MTVSERFQGANVVDAGVLSPYWGEHAARYLFAREYVKNKTVLDIACGTGYGLGLLSKIARAVAGVDVDLSAARLARSECTSNVAVILGDGTRLPFEDCSFDVITSFETLEHLYHRVDFLAELRRVLKDGGTLLLSTPNANYTQPVNGKPANPFHVYEYRPEELREEVAAVFRLEQFLGQELRTDFGIPPFFDAQQKLPSDLGTMTRLLGWKVLNKLPISLRENVSEALWKRPFYPVEKDYIFSPDRIENAPVLVAICQK